MAAPRVDLYLLIHKVLRAMLGETCSRIAAANFADEEQRAAVCRDWQRTRGFLDEHSHLEDQFIEPALARVSPELAAKVNKTHEQLEATIAELAGIVAQLESKPSSEAVALGATLYHRYCQFIAAYFTHLAEEEDENNKALWANYTDAELAEIRTAIQSSLPPQRYAEWFSLMLQSMNHHECVGVFSGMKLNAPPPVFEKMSATAREILGNERWSQVEKSLPAQ